MPDQGRRASTDGSGMTALSDVLAAPASEATPETDADAVERLLEEYRRSGDPTFRDEAIVRGEPLARMLARKFEGRGEESDDLRQVAMLGLISAINRFDHEYPNGFAAFAVTTIMGELKRHMRDKTWAVHVPRGVKERSLHLRAGLEALERKCAPVTVANLAAETGMSEEDVLEAMEGYQGRLAISLHAPPAGRVDDSDTLVERLADADSGYEMVVDLVSLAPALSALDGRDRQILSLRFGHELSQREIGEHIGVSQMHVSRLLRQVCERLRSSLVDA